MYIEAHVVKFEACAMLLRLLHPLNLLQRTDSAQRQVSQVWIPEKVFAGEAVGQDVDDTHSYQDA